MSNEVLLQQYQKILALCVEHMDNCHTFEKQVIDNFDFEEKKTAWCLQDPNSQHQTTNQPRLKEAV